MIFGASQEAVKILDGPEKNGDAWARARCVEYRIRPCAGRNDADIGQWTDGRIAPKSAQTSPFFSVLIHDFGASCDGISR